MKHLDLFSGIGGFALAVDTVWPGSEHIFCDNNLFCQQVLKKHWPNSKIYGDIRTLTNTANTGSEKVRERKDKVFLVTGGFPCQPFSQAGRRRGAEDDRFLWPEMLRVIREFQPEWIIAENVRGLVTQDGGVVFEQVCLDLEAENYEVQPFVIPAVAVNAPHRRDRVWFIAHSKSVRFGGWSGEKCEVSERIVESGEQQGREVRGKIEGRLSWWVKWKTVAADFCGMDDGLPVKLDGFKLTKAKHREERIKSLGNSIVPQVAIQIMQAIKLSTENTCASNNGLL